VDASLFTIEDREVSRALLCKVLAIECTGESTHAISFIILPASTRTGEVTFMIEPVAEAVAPINLFQKD
jgi:hypothetical protein